MPVVKTEYNLHPFLPKHPKALNEIAQQRKQSLAQMAITWLMKDKRVTTVLIGASSVRQLDNNLDSLHQIDYTQEELQLIETILAK